MIKAILTDIEGTTSSVSFVFEVLFPYARAHLADFVRAHAEDPAVRAALHALAAEEGRPLNDEEAIAVLLGYIDADKKATSLKALQGMIWKAGYLDGSFTGHVYDDAAERLRAWHREGLLLYVYSSGSVEAQKLIFGYSDHGDLTGLFAGYFDTTTGPKREADSYRKIVDAIGVAAHEILFLSDVEAELEAAAAAGMRTTWLVRDGVLDSGARHPQVQSFADIEVE